MAQLGPQPQTSSAHHQRLHPRLMIQMEKKILIKGEFVVNLFWCDSISVCSDWGCKVTLQDNLKAGPC